MKHFRSINIPIIFFCVFSFLLMYSYSHAYTVGIICSTILMVISEKFKYDEYKCADEIKKELLKELQSEINSKYNNLEIKITEIKTDIAKTTLGNKFMRK